MAHFLKINSGPEIVNKHVFLFTVKGGRDIFYFKVFLIETFSAYVDVKSYKEMNYRFINCWFIVKLS